MAYSTQRATSDGTLKTLLLSIEFFSPTEISVYLDEVPQVVGVGYTWATGTSIQFTNTLGAGVNVLVQRHTDISASRHMFTQGAQFKASTLDENATQLLRVAQEAAEGGGLSDVFSDVNLHGHRIVNLGPASLDNHALSYGQFKAESTGAYAARVAAEAAASTANAAKVSAEAARDVASTHAGTATTKAADAAASATDAATSATASGTAQAAAVVAKDAAVVAQAASELALDQFTDVYLGAKASDPVLDNDAQPLQVGALYWNTGANSLRVWSGTLWELGYSAATGFALRSQNLADLTSIPAARQNLGMQAAEVSPSFRNKFANGTGSVATRGGTIASVSPGLGLATCWRGGGSTYAATMTYTRSPGPANIPYAIRLTAQSVSAVGASTNTLLVARVEGSDYGDLVGKDFCISFWVRSATVGTHCVSLSNVLNDACLVLEYTVLAANTWEYKTVLVPGGLVGTWARDPGSALSIRFCLQAGSAQHAAAGVWGGVSQIATVNQVNAFPSGGSIFSITNLQVEAGAVPTPYEDLPIALVQARCARYVVLVNGLTFNSLVNGHPTFGLGGNMRATPTISNIAFRAGTGATFGTLGAYASCYQSAPHPASVGFNLILDADM